MDQCAFSRAGSWFAINYQSSTQDEFPAGLYLRTAHGGMTLVESRLCKMELLTLTGAVQPDYKSTESAVLLSQRGRKRGRLALTKNHSVHGKFNQAGLKVSIL